MTWVNNKIGLSTNKIFNNQKETLFSSLHEHKVELDRNLQILEIGAGGGANMKYYPRGTEIVCLDPNPRTEAYIQKKVDEFNLTMKSFVKGFAENMEQIPDDSCDAVVSTLVLCSVRDTKAALSEVKRVLKPASRSSGIVYIINQSYVM